MSDLRFGGAPKNGKQVLLKRGNPQPTPYHVEVWIDGKLVETRKFATDAEARKFQSVEVARTRGPNLR